MKNIFYITAIILIVENTAYAYLDPGSGSYLWQIVIATLLSASYFISTKFHHFREFIKNLIKKMTGKK